MITVKCPRHDYKLVRSCIENGYGLACSGNGLFSDGIKAFETDKPLRVNDRPAIITHVGTFLWIYEELFVVEAVGSVRLVRFSTEYKGYDGRLFVLKPKFKDALERFNFIKKQVQLVGKDYDWQDIKIQALNKLGLDKKHIEDDKWFCSEMVNMAKNYEYGKKDEFTTPHKIALQLEFFTELSGVGM